MSREEIIKQIDELENQLVEFDEDEEFYRETRKGAKRLKCCLDIYCEETGLTKSEMIQFISACNGGTVINNNLKEME